MLALKYVDMCSLFIFSDSAKFSTITLTKTYFSKLFKNKILQTMSKILGHVILINTLITTNPGTEQMRKFLTV